MTVATYPASSFPRRLGKRESKIIETARAGLNSDLDSGKIFVGDSSGAAAACTLSGDAAVSNTGVVTVSAVRGVKVVATAAELITAVGVAAANDVIILKDGVYTLVAPLAITVPLTLVAHRSAYLVGGAHQTICTIELATQSAESSVSFKRIDFSHGVVDHDCVAINNTSVGQKLNVYFDGCSFSMSGTGKSILVAHATAAKAIVVRVRGSGSEKLGAVHVATGNAGDMFEATLMRCDLAGSAANSVTTAGATAGATTSFKYCECVTGHLLAADGSVTGQTASALYCWSDNGAGTLAAVVAGDLTAVTAKIVGT